MLDIKFIRENRDLVKKAAADKNFDAPVDEILELDSTIKPLQQELEGLQSKRNAISKRIPQTEDTERSQLIQSVKEMRRRMDTLQHTISTSSERLKKLMLLVPQPARSDVPIGKHDGDNLEVRRWGQIPEFSFTPKDHVCIGEERGLIDIKRGVKLSGSRSYVLTGDGALLEQALLRFAYDHVFKRGFRPMSVPVLVREKAMEGTGYFPIGRDQAYYVEKDKLALVGTSEVALCSYFADETLLESQLPITLMAQSSCFRREAGTYGKDTHGLYRVHQFQKIEMLAITEASAAASESLHERLLSCSEEILQLLELPYRVVYVCTGDLGQGQLRKHDLETWMPSRNSYGETNSCSSFNDFQARRLGIRYKTSEGKRAFAYTLNNTALAAPRVILAILENFQQADGSVKIPEILRPYLSGRAFI